ncbi:phage tail assembly protein [Desulfobulbus elongatus]|uniref:phage tail assembly protein n=1 Tax=Desulfobulbus elongatus TaxID=53332 RepID=UPI00048364C3|nr:phage tail assembly protein [Desulfobulbus elongatus]
MATITLKDPVTVAGQEYKELTMRAPKVRDMLAASKGGKNDAEQELALFANLCEVAPDVILELDMADYVKMQGMYKGFLS